jgi:hypothetical protein
MDPPGFWAYVQVERCTVQSIEMISDPSSDLFHVQRSFEIFNKKENLFAEEKFFSGFASSLFS